MNKFLALNVFTKVVQNGGFTASADIIGMSVSAVSKTISRLEDDLGAKLFTRSTRQLTTTEIGEKFYHDAMEILSRLETAEESVRFNNAEPAGRIQVLLPNSFGRVTVIPRLSEFRARWPEIQVVISFADSNSTLDMVAENIDVAVKTGDISDSGLITRNLTRTPKTTVASPAYLAQYGTPKVPADLANHNCLVGGRFNGEWHFSGPDEEASVVKVKSQFVIHSADALREAAVQSVGILHCTEWLVRKDIELGLLVPVLQDYGTEKMPISLLYPADRNLPKRVRLFIDFLIEITDEAGLIQ